MAESTEFRVVFEGVELPKEERSRINRAIQRAVLTELADLDIGYQVDVRSPLEATRLAPTPEDERIVDWDIILGLILGPRR